MHAVKQNLKPNLFCTRNHCKLCNTFHSNVFLNRSYAQHIYHITN